MPRLIYALSGWDGGAYIASRVESFAGHVLLALLVIVLWIKLSSTPGEIAIIVDARTFGKPGTMQFVIRYSRSGVS